MIDAGSLAQHLADVRARIDAAAARVGRDAGTVQPVAVTKGHPPEMLLAAYDAGLRLFGESYAQELAEKAAAVAHLPGTGIRLIGHLQRNKAALAVRHAASVDTVDSARLARTLARLAAEAGRQLPVLIQVNLGGEAQKSGCTPEELPALVAEVRALGALSLRGLFTVPPHDEDPERARPFFRRLRELAADGGLRELSMGMTHDFEVAVEEGATMVRIGTALFGPREP